MYKKTYFSKLKPGDVFQPPVHPECRCLKVGLDYYMTLDNCALHWDDDLEYFADCRDIFMDNDDMFVEVIYKEGEWKIAPKEGYE